MNHELGIKNQGLRRLKSIFNRLIPYSLFLIPSITRAAEDFGLEETARAANLPRTGAGPAAVAGVITGYLLAFVGVIFFVLMLYGGIRWMTARGNEEQIKKAQELIKSAVIGVVIIFLSYVLTRFVIRNLIEATSQ